MWRFLRGVGAYASLPDLWGLPGGALLHLGGSRGAPLAVQPGDIPIVDLTATVTSLAVQANLADYQAKELETIAANLRRTAVFLRDLQATLTGGV